MDINYVNYHNQHNQHDQHNRQPKFVRLSALYTLYMFNILTLVVVLLALSGCGATSDPKDPDESKNVLSASALQSQSHAAAVPDIPQVPTVGTALPTVTALATLPQPPTSVGTGTPDALATRIAHATRIAQFRSDLRTSVALTHAPTVTPGLPPAYPSPTPMLGMLVGCSNANTYEPQAVSCWRGVVNGELVDVDAGREGRSGDVTQGIIMVHIHGQEGEDVYQTPNRVGTVRIVSVSGALFTLATVDLPTPVEFVFDLATRQWVSP